MNKSVLFALALAASAFSVGSTNAQDTDVGKDLYAGLCAACHGDTGKGDGDMANVMTIPSPNLTLLAKNNGGEFPMLQVIQIIDGRSGVRAHGGPMPIFGAVFAPKIVGPGLRYGTEVEARGRILSHAQYLESIQQ